MVLKPREAGPYPCETCDWPRAMEEDEPIGLRGPLPVADSGACMGERYELQSRPLKYDEEVA